MHWWSQTMCYQLFQESYDNASGEAPLHLQHRDSTHLMSSQLCFPVIIHLMPQKCKIFSLPWTVGLGAADLAATEGRKEHDY